MSDAPVVAYAPVSMDSGEDWLYRPVLRGFCKLESLLDGTLSLADIAKLHEAMEVEEENKYRAGEAIRRSHGR